MMEFYNRIENADPNRQNLALTVVEGQAAGEKALVIDRRLAWESSDEGYFTEHREEIEQIQDHGLTVVRPAGLFLSFCHCFRKFKASRFMKSMPVCMAPSRGENEAVWVRPAPGPTPSR